MSKASHNTHPLQKQAALILNDLRDFFNCHHENTIKFWECPSKSKWNLHKHADIETKLFYLTLLLPAKNSWDLARNLNVTTSSVTGKWLSKYLIWREIIS